ncbi:MAG TPA: hypothetical protein DEB40_14680 [Elusimicrobia bacterium]|nr:hypothetical protein [Elusimicrobiota bacterium]HBT62980.1 hypothetical protein [Elusimicrobiota bacterium]
MMLGVCLLTSMMAVAQQTQPAEQKPAAAASEKKMEHSGDKAKCRCSECDMDMKNLKEMRGHMKSHHGMEGYCDKCAMGFKTKAEEKAHRKEMHGKAAKKAVAQPEPEKK